jgi:hypothetical protein
VFEPGRPYQVKALGRIWTLSRLELSMIFEFRDWIKTKLPDPLGGPIAKIFDRLPVEEQIERVKKAERIAEELNCFSLTSSLARQYMGTEQGIAKLGQIWLRQYHPDIDEATAFLVMQEAMPELAKAFQHDDGPLLDNGAKPAGANGQSSKAGPAGLATDLSGLAVGGNAA